MGWRREVELGEIRGEIITVSEPRPAWDDPTKQTEMKIAVLVYDAAILRFPFRFP